MARDQGAARQQQREGQQHQDRVGLDESPSGMPLHLALLFRRRRAGEWELRLHFLTYYFAIEAAMEDAWAGLGKPCQ